MIYVASPYSKDKERGAKAVNAFCAWCANRGEHVFSSIAHWHSIAKRHGLPTHFEYWQEYDFEFIRASRAVYVLCIPGWEESVGVKAEIEYAHSLRRPIVLFTPNKEGGYNEFQLPGGRNEGLRRETNLSERRSTRTAEGSRSLPLVADGSDPSSSDSSGEGSGEV